MPLRSLNLQASEIAWKCAWHHLETRVEREKIERHLRPIIDRPQRMSEVYRRLLDSLRNRRHVATVVGGIEGLQPVLCSFDPNQVREIYGGDHLALYRRVRQIVKPNLPTEPKRTWRDFCMGALDGARYLAQFRDAEHFRVVVDLSAEDAQLAPGLPLMLSQEIYGYGFVLACDFLKELGWVSYPKPDVHLNALFSGLGFSDGTDYATFKAIVRMAEMLDETAYTVDKLFWLIGSGKLYLYDERFPTDRDSFIEETNAALEEQGY